MPVIRWRNHAQHVVQPRLVKDFWAILKQEVCTGRLVETSEMTPGHWVLETQSLCNKEVLHIMIREVGACGRQADLVSPFVSLSEKAVGGKFIELCKRCGINPYVYRGVE